MSTDVNRRIRLRARPEGRIDDTTFELVEEAVPEPGDGQALIRNLYLSIDPTNRVWIREEPSYLPPVGIGEVMRSGGIGRVVASKNDGFPVGSLVTGLLGWQDYVLAGEGESTLAMLLSLPNHDWDTAEEGEKNIRAGIQELVGNDRRQLQRIEGLICAAAH